jgi:hypothetical protein
MILDVNNKQGYNINKNANNYLLNLFYKLFPSIKFKNASTKEIEKIINYLKIKESSGNDEISTKILKISVPLLVLLGVIFVISLCYLELFLLD